MLRRRKQKVIFYFFCSFIIILIYHLSGLKDYINAEDFTVNFDYPLNVDIIPLIEEVLSGKKPSIDPINQYPYNYTSHWKKCETGPLDLVVLVKSAMKHFDNRKAIRKTWGREDYAYNHIRVFFVLGMDESPNSRVQHHINDEIAQYNDIIQINFIDYYYNNTIKTMMAFRWAYENCFTAQMYLFADDDMYISISNLIAYTNKFNNKPSIGNEFDNKEDLFLSGFVFQSRPLRYTGSKWRVSLEEYRWNLWPPYVSAGAYVISRNALSKLYLGSQFVKHFRFDDIYLGIVAMKVGITPLHSVDFYFYKKPFSVEGYKNVIASHGYGDPKELSETWMYWNSRDYPTTMSL